MVLSVGEKHIQDNQSKCLHKYTIITQLNLQSKLEDDGIMEMEEKKR